MSETPTTDINDNDFDEFAKRAVEFVKESTQPNPVVNQEQVLYSPEATNNPRMVATLKKMAAVALAAGATLGMGYLASEALDSHVQGQKDLNAQMEHAANLAVLQDETITDKSSINLP